jgi:hypothetical protein
VLGAGKNVLEQQFQIHVANHFLSSGISPPLSMDMMSIFYLKAKLSNINL